MQMGSGYRIHWIVYLNNCLKTNPKPGPSTQMVFSGCSIVNWLNFQCFIHSILLRNNWFSRHFGPESKNKRTVWWLDQRTENRKQWHPNDTSAKIHYFTKIYSKIQAKLIVSMLINKIIIIIIMLFQRKVLVCLSVRLTECQCKLVKQFSFWVLGEKNQSCQLLLDISLNNIPLHEWVSDLFEIYCSILINDIRFWSFLYFLPVI